VPLQWNRDLKAANERRDERDEGQQMQKVRR
jgi:hypothetical protein